MSTLKQLKDFFRTRIKVVPGGPPIGTPGANRSQGVLDALDKLAEELKAGGTGGGGTAFSLAAMPNGNYQPNPALAAYLDAGGEIYWMSPDPSGLRTTIYAKNFNVLPANTAAANAAGVDAMRTNLLGQ